MKFIRVQERTGGININTNVSGSGKPVLLLHGHISGGYAWRHQEGALNEAGFETIVPDMLGYGESNKKFEYNYSYVNQAIVCREVLHKLNINRVDIVAIGFGARVAIALATKFPEMVHSLTLVNCVIHEPFYNLLGRISVIQNFRRFALKNKWRSKRGFIKSMKEMSGADVTADTIDQRWQYYQREEDKEALVAMQRDSYQFSLKEQVSEVHCPVHLIWSANSPLAPLQDAEALRQELTGVKNKIDIDVIEKGGHFVNEDMPGVFNKYMIDFLKSINL